MKVCTGIELDPKAFSSQALFSQPDCFVAITSSRLGHDAQLHRQVCRFLSHRMMDLRHRSAHLLVAANSAIEPLAMRAAELFRIPITRLFVDEKCPSLADYDCSIYTNKRLSRDQLLLGIADRVDAVYVRPKGKIAAALEQRIKTERSASTRVAVINQPKNAAAELIDSGAIGWFLTGSRNDFDDMVARRAELDSIDYSSPSWIHDANRWLIHCTRGCTGAWPGQTVKQYQDEMLLGDAGVTQRTAFDVLVRIVQKRRLIANAVTSAKAYPVVCFSQRSLAECLRKRIYRSHVGRWDGEPYGIAIDLEAARRIGIRPVLYGDHATRPTIDRADQYRFQARGKTFDWTAEREWRADRSVDLMQFSADQVRVFVATESEAARLRSISKWEVGSVESC
ncbi:hypothetical protein [Novipirellula aureliae]|uniref:hypothetical protein n=1 Tax=Novipirellula aureliae TaxID=2527966 RepID=UPI0011B37CF2|nr:hypothetical protein [Novipirellula aureliae]